ncbi:hypothetical protein HID58_013027 [Brassica napus]|uniref:Uncharacterized protein n=1 Tax=Brassica napus TaxID=3708 RepID=A0ABQ8E2T6_BRANA|nr:hypothetical protein HID58_013027 [Brassica napus]
MNIGEKREKREKRLSPAYGRRVSIRAVAGALFIQQFSFSPPCFRSAINGCLVEALIPQLTFSVVGFGVKTRRLESLEGDGIFVGSDCVSPGDGGFSRFIDAGLSAGGGGYLRSTDAALAFGKGGFFSFFFAGL